MPRTIEEGFRTFLNTLTPTLSESNAAKNHRESVARCIESNYGLRRFWRTGSFGNGTSISYYSDVDYMASIPREQLTNNSASTLRKMRSALEHCFPNTGVKGSCPAIVVPFGSLAKETTEITPAGYIRSQDGYKLYDIPDCQEGWRKASPDAHNAYINNIDRRLNGKVKPLIRFIKAWKYYNQVPVLSFYLELRVAKYADDESSIIYNIDVKRVLEILDKIGFARIQDPMGMAGYVDPCSSYAALREAKSKVATAAARARNAREAEVDGKTKEVFEWWDKVYASRFPSYYY